MINEDLEVMWVRLQAEIDLVWDRLQTAEATILAYENDCAVLPEDQSVTETVMCLRTKCKTIEATSQRLHDVLFTSEQTLRNLGNGDLTGDAATIALNAAANAKEVLDAEVE